MDLGQPLSNMNDWRDMSPGPRRVQQAPFLNVSACTMILGHPVDVVAVPGRGSISSVVHVFNRFPLALS